MKISVINGSPKGKHSITLRHIQYLINENPEHHFDIFHVSNRISRIETDETLFGGIVENMAGADAVLWAFPVYYMLVPAQLKRFIELLFERAPTDLFKGKYATAFTTSIHFFDHTAHNYLQGVCEALGFSYVRSYSAHMNDFFKKEERAQMSGFYDWFIRMVEEKVPASRKFPPVPWDPIDYAPKHVEHTSISSDRRALLLTDATRSNTNLNKMTEAFQAISPMPVNVINIHDIGMKAGCLGCCVCGYDNTCVQKDGYGAFFNETLAKADVIIMAGTIRDHYLSATWKKFFDRSFFKGHAPVLMGKRLGFMISGPLGRLQNLREILELFADVWHMKSVGIVTDEHGTSEEITEHLRAFATELALADKQDLVFAPRFYRVAGMKIFRDFIYNASAIFAADHRFYKAHGVYRDFPQRKIKKRLSNAVFRALLAIRPLRKKIHQDFIHGMVAPYDKVLGRACPKPPTDP